MRKFPSYEFDVATRARLKVTFNRGWSGAELPTRISEEGNLLLRWLHARWIKAGDDSVEDLPSCFHLAELLPDILDEPSVTLHRIAQEGLNVGIIADRDQLLIEPGQLGLALYGLLQHCAGVLACMGAIDVVRVHRITLSHRPIVS